MPYILYILDIAIVAAAVASAWFWLQASTRRLRRVSKFEDFDHADFNRVVTALNRAGELNARAALATACASLLAGTRLTADLIL